MAWTKEQLQAITARKKNILVSAAAGSGKTAVLIERIKRLILEDRCSVDRMLIVTFTNKAAAEMRGRLEKAISKAIEETKTDSDLVYLKSQLDLLPLANISTFHAFSLEVIHRYFYLIDVEPNFKICDEVQATLLKEEALDDLLEELFSENDAFFIDFLKKHSGDRNESRFREMIAESYETIMALPEPLPWLRDAVSKLNEPLADSDSFKILWADVEEAYSRAVKLLDISCDECEKRHMNGMKELALKDKVEVSTLEQGVKTHDFEMLRTAINDIKFATASKSYYQPEANNVGTSDMPGDFNSPLDIQTAWAKLKDRRQEVKDIIKDLKADYFYDSLENLESDVKSTYEDALLLEAYIERYDEIYKEKKLAKGMVDFNDIEHMAFDILKNEEAAGFYREKFEHVFVDEYQDSNVIQEALIDRIARDNNRFMVGDVKQSIYKFRLAEPEIFQRRYRDYKAVMSEAGERGEEPKSVKIDLNKNFRSKSPVIDFINTCFLPLMDDYEEQKLYAGDMYADQSSWKPKMYLTSTYWDNEEELDDELKNLQKAQKEALACVKIISDSLGKPFFDSKRAEEQGEEKGLRQLEKKDVVILMRSVKNYGDVFYKTLQENNIPSFVDDNDGYFDTIEINTFLALLNVIDNEKQDIPLLTVMRSEVFNFSIEELVELRLRHKAGTYFDAVKAASEEEDGLGLRCRDIFEKINMWRALRKGLTLEDFIWELMLSTGFYIAIGALPSGTQRQANLRALVDKALQYRKSQGGSLYGFIKYIDCVKQKKVPMGQVKLIGEDDDTVRIMTIHKSKGLEFPMVIVCGFNRELRYTPLGKKAVIHKDVGVGLPVVNYKESWYKTTIIQSIIKSISKNEEVEEQKRVLYVAMTRARDILYMLGICDDPDEEMLKALDGAPKMGSYFGMIGHTMMNIPGTVSEIANADIIGFHRQKKRTTGEVLELIDSEPVAISEETRRKMEYAYPFEKELSSKSKYSVSELNARDYVYEKSLSAPQSFKQSEDFTKAQIGTFTHKFLEKMDFVKATEPGYLEGLRDELISKEFLTEEEANTVDLKKLGGFAESELGKRIAKAQETGTLRREQNFNLKMDVDGIESIVQGVIDCFFVEDGEVVLIDYKTTSHMDKVEIKHTYERQIGIYRTAIEEALKLPVKESYLYLTNLNTVVDMND